jgi:hypothetical protein
MKIGKRRAASLKGWRTRKRMQAARSSREAAAVAYREYMAERAAERKAARSRELKPGDCVTIAKGTPYETTVLIVADSGSSAWPEYKRRALPLPDFGKVR